MAEGSTKKLRRKLHPKLAVALRYDAEQGKAPMVVASGRGHMAERIASVAEEAGVPVHQDPDLAVALSDVEVQQTIPEELFEAVARVLAFVWRVDHRKEKGGKKS